MPRLLSPDTAGGKYKGKKLCNTEKAFRYALNADAMATEKLAEGIRGFCADIEKLEAIMRDKIEESMYITP